MKTDIDLNSVTNDVEKSAIVDYTILSENEQNATSLNNGESVEMSKTKLFDENGETRKDSQGNEFDPELHDVDDDGSPKITSTGKLRKKRKTKASTLSTSTAAQAASKVAISDKEKYRVMGESCANALIAGGLMLGGEDFQPVTNNMIDERKNMEMAFAQWAETKEINDIPPNMALLLVVGSYLLPRLTKPKQLNKFKLMGLWLRAKFTKKPKGAKSVFDPNKKKEG